MTEHAFYNALNIVTQSNYARLSALKSRCTLWEKAWHTLEHTLDGKTELNPKEEWRKLEEAGIRLLLREDSEYPAILNEIPEPPWGIYVRGTLPQKDAAKVAVVGTRKASEEGKRLAYDFAKQLAYHEIIIVSGLALGIDAAAHKGALDAGGHTIAVLGTGLDRIYPTYNKRIGENIAVSAGGALISEYPLGAPPLPYHFLERNRIISGLSKGVIIIEAPENSGALTTARLAAEYNREVFVLPGSAKNPLYRGSHRLIREGATLVTEVNEILEELGIKPQNINIPIPEAPEAEGILATIKSSPMPLSVDKIIELTNLNAKTVNQLMTLLLLQGKIREDGEGYTAT